MANQRVKSHTVTAFKDKSTFAKKRNNGRAASSTIEVKAKPNTIDPNRRSVVVTATRTSKATSVTGSASKRFDQRKHSAAATIK